MRCKNCGWPNDDDAKRCVKCNAPLLRPTVVTGQSDNQPAPSHHRAVTPPVPETRPVNIKPEPARPRAATSLTNEWSACPVCGYPVSRKLSRCPGCGSENKGYIDTDTPVVKKEERKEDNVKKTPRLPDDEPPVTTHIPVDRLNVKTGSTGGVTIKRESWINENCDHAATSLDGDRVTLNRPNCDPDNTTIDAACHAVLVNEGGEWFIENKSGAATTYVKVTRRIKLEDGDTIVMGNRSFTFHKK